MIVTFKRSVQNTSFRFNKLTGRAHHILCGGDRVRFPVESLETTIVASVFFDDF